MVIQVIQVKVIQEDMVAIQVIQDMEVMEDMDMDTHMVNNIAIVNLQQENLLTNSVLHQETITNLNIPIKMELNSRTQISTEEPSSLTFNNHQPPLQLTLRECL